MPFLIDGHNLIPKVAGLSLQAVDDEQQLIEMLQEFCRVHRKQVEVFFDNAPPGGVRARNLGLVIARFVRQGSSADQAIAARLRQLGRGARNWTVVTSDLAVQAEARAAQARVLPAEEFARLLRAALDENRRDPGEQMEAGMSEDELQDWLKMFGE
ncbi:MAG: hypothetical protein B6D39_12490 [Anaerolineae bacterium UTCFX2]|jgi:predicted RNA-binding protein with PIN domain|nr:NYN domain-containing protein [Anaerolineae bacterium]MCZ7552594.1 NYN domain-containing protein [Anaerolineales bacterium]OQY87726.1 MAG: hypothetical protein B6D39_12490 [Anaerolineae bacterium UTCFX2]